MRILYVCQRVPYPPNRGDKIASFHAISRLARAHSVSAAALADSPEELDHARTLARSGVQTLVARHPAGRARWNALRALAGATPLSVAYHRSGDLVRQIARAAREEPFDVVVAFSSSMAQYAELLPDVPLVADFVDLDSQKWALYARHRRWPRSRVYAEEARRLLAYERSVAARARRTLVRTRAELEDCRRLLPEGRFEVLSNGVDGEYFRSSGPKAPSNDVVFTGVMDYFPNVHGIVFFAEQVFPIIRAEIPEATFTIVGARPIRAVRRLGTIRGVTVTGAVPDVRPFLERAAVAVAPLELARGIQNKALEALAMNTPAVVSTPVSRGIDGAAGEGFLVADEPGDVAAAVVGLLENRDSASELGRRGRALVERRYSWERTVARLETLLAEASGEGRTPQTSAATG